MNYRKEYVRHIVESSLLRAFSLFSQLSLYQAATKGEKGQFLTL